MKRLLTYLTIFGSFGLAVYAWVNSTNNLRQEHRIAQQTVVYTPSVGTDLSSPRMARGKRSARTGSHGNANKLFPSITSPASASAVGGARAAGSGNLMSDGYGSGASFKRTKADGGNAIGAAPTTTYYAMGGRSRGSESASASGGGSLSVMQGGGNATTAVSPMFRGFGDDGEDPLDPGGGENPPGSYNDAPVGDAVWMILLLAGVYALLSRLRKETRKRIPELLINHS